jgi:hypothetical protein
MRRYTIKELNELTDRELLHLVVLDRRSTLTNYYTPLYKRLTQLSGRLEDEPREVKLLEIIDKQLVHQGKQDQTNYSRGFIKGIEWTKTEIQKMFGK